jgi:ComF family protein
MMKIITKFKYYFVKDITDTLIELIVSATDYPLFFKQPWVMVPIPLHVSRKRWRGFNQAEVLADGLAQAWGWPLLTDLLIRGRNTLPQMKLSGRKRKDNLRGAFEVKKRVAVPGRIILIDDVATTCSTLNECARVLKKAGAKEVWGLTLAQAIPK